MLIRGTSKLQQHSYDFYHQKQFCGIVWGKIFQELQPPSYTYKENYFLEPFITRWWFSWIKGGWANEDLWTFITLPRIGEEGDLDLVLLLIDRFLDHLIPLLGARVPPLIFTVLPLFISHPLPIIILSYLLLPILWSPWAATLSPVDHLIWAVFSHWNATSLVNGKFWSCNMFCSSSIWELPAPLQLFMQFSSPFHVLSLAKLFYSLTYYILILYGCRN